jgi:N-acyl-L-homoserine lactone synthetase
MIYVIESSNRTQFKNQLRRFFLSRYLYETIRSRVKTQNLTFEDEFDTDEAIYIVYIDDRYPLCAGLRLVPIIEQSPATTTYSSINYQPLNNPKNPYYGVGWVCNSFFIDLPRTIPEFENRYIEMARLLLNTLKDFIHLRDITSLNFSLPADTHQILSRHDVPFKGSNFTFSFKEASCIQNIKKFSEASQKGPCEKR